MKELSDDELQMKLHQQKQRYYKAEKMFEQGTQEFQDKHYAGLCKVLDNIVVLTREISRRRNQWKQSSIMHK